MDTFEILSTLCKPCGVSGEEENASNAALSLLKSIAPNASVDSFHNVTAEIKGRGKKKILLDAHIDQVGFIVTYITDDGFLKFAPVGGIDKRLLPAQRVKIMAPDGVLDGVITSVPPHLSDDNDKAQDIDSYYIDAGLEKSEAAKLIPLGTRVTYATGLSKLCGDRVLSKALDDRVGAAVILKALELTGKDSVYDISVSFCCQEETGESGAKMTAYRAKADLAVAVDVSFAMARGEKKEKCGEMGKGAMVGIAPSLSKEMSDAFIKTAQDKDIPYQIEVMNGSTGTDADAIGVSCGGVKTVTLSVPIKYMHTPAEVVSLADIDSTALLLAEFLKGGEV